MRLELLYSLLYIFMIHITNILWVPQFQRGVPGRGSKGFEHLPIPIFKIAYSLYSGGEGGEEGGLATNFQKANFLHLSPNLKLPFLKGGGVNFQLLMLSPNLLKSKNYFTRGFAEILLSFRTKSMLAH